VLAKSVGWGWLGYHAFLAGHRLAGFVPPILGLRDGILYMEWIPQPALGLEADSRREERIDTAASYVAARARRLSLDAKSAAHLNLGRQDNGVRLLGKALSRAHGGFLTDLLTQPRLGRRLRQQPCPFPTLIDGNMRRGEWIVGSFGLLKTDYEHHGSGKEELNVIDPAYDLADTILNLELSPEEETRLIGRYVDESGDAGVEQRLFMNKMLAGLWAMKQAHEHLFSRAWLAERQQTFHRRFMSAWNFLTVQSARQCGSATELTSVPGSGGISRNGLSITSRWARCIASGRNRLMIKPMIVKVANTGRTKIADSRASRLDCHEAGPKCAVAGRSRQSGEFTVLRVSGSRASPAVSFASTCGDSCVGHYRTRSDRHRIAKWARRPRRVLIQFEKYSKGRAGHHHVEAGRPRGHRHR